MQKFAKGTTPTLVSYPRVSAGGHFLRRAPSAVSIKVVSAGSTQTAFEVATVDAVSTTVSGAVDEGADSLIVASAAGFSAGRRYLIAISADENIDVTAKRNSGTTIVLAEPLPRSVANSAAFVGWACTHALTADETAVSGHGTARFRATIDSLVHEWDEEFKIVDRLLVSTLTPTRLTQAFPIIVSLRPKKDPDFEEVLRLAWDHEVLPWLELSGFHEEYVQSAEALEPLHALACVLMLARPSPGFPRETLETLERMWTERSNATKARVSWYAAPPLSEPVIKPEDGAPVFSYSLVSR